MPTIRPSNDGLPWTRDHLILALDLYCRIPFKKTKASNPEVQRVAAMIGRTPASVARKLGNFGAFDPQLETQNITGLTHGSRLDRLLWDEFHHNWGQLADEAEKLKILFGFRPVEDLLVPPDGPSERIVTAKQRLHQVFFRSAVLASYDYRCCLTGLPVIECLVASHIIPWGKDESRRADPRNGLCLSATFDRLFDRGLITVDESLHVKVSPDLLRIKNDIIQQDIAPMNGQPLIRPSKFLPDAECLSWHNQNVFRAS